MDDIHSPKKPRLTGLGRSNPATVDAQEEYLPTPAARHSTSNKQTDKWFLVAITAVVIVLLAAVGAYKLIHPKHSLPASPNVSPTTAQSVAQQQVQALTGQTTSRSSHSSAYSANQTSELPQFTVYYPTTPPAGQTVDKSSVTFGKDQFSFSIQQNSHDDFFISEQPAGNNFSFQRLKVKLGSPIDINTPLGNGVFGAISDNFITAVKTDKNTLIVINCTALACTLPTKDLLAVMLVNTDPAHIK